MNDIPKPPPPDDTFSLALTLKILEAGPPVQGTAGRKLLQKVNSTLRLTIDKPFPVERAEILWQVRRGGESFEDIPAQRFEPPEQDEWKADLSKVFSQRGVYEFRAVVRFKGAKPQTFEKTLALHYLPPPPSITPDAEWIKYYFKGGDLKDDLDLRDDPRLPVKAAATPRAGVIKVIASVGLENALRPVPDPADIKDTIKVATGVPNSVVVVEAFNEGAEGELKIHETATWRLRVHYIQPNVPSIYLDTWTRLFPAGSRPEPISSDLIEVPVRRIRIQGRIKADEMSKEIIKDAQIQVRPGKERPLTAFKPGKEVPIDEELTLEPEVTTVSFRAKTENSDWSPWTELKLNYLPPLPALQIDNLPDGFKVTESPFNLKAALIPDGEDPRPFTVVVKLDGKEQGTQKFDAGWTADVAVELVTRTPAQAARIVDRQSMEDFSSDCSASELSSPAADHSD